MNAINAGSGGRDDGLIEYHTFQFEENLKKGLIRRSKKNYPQIKDHEALADQSIDAALSRTAPIRYPGQFVKLAYQKQTILVKEVVDEQYHLSSKSGSFASEEILRRSRQESDLDPAINIEQKALVWEINEAINCLPKMSQVVINLRVRKQKSFGEIAKILGITEKTASNIFRRAINRLKRDPAFRGFA